MSSSLFLLSSLFGSFHRFIPDFFAQFVQIKDDKYDLCCCHPFYLSREPVENDHVLKDLSVDLFLFAQGCGSPALRFRSAAAPAVPQMRNWQ